MAIDRETVGVALALVAAAALTLAFTTLSTRMLGARAAADFLTGVFALSFTLTAVGPLGGTASRYAARYRVREEYGSLRGLPLSLALVSAVAMAGLGGLLLVLGSTTSVLSLWSMSVSWWLITASTAIVLTFVALVRGMLRGLGRFTDFNENVFVESVTRFGLGLALVALFRTAAAGIAGYALGASIGLLLGWKRVSRRLGSGPRSPVDPRRYLAFLIPMALMALAHAAYQNLDVLVVRGLFEPNEAGAYGAAAILAQLATLLLTPFSTTLLPRASALHARMEATSGDWGLLLLRHMCGYLAACIPLLVAFGLGGKWLVTALYGPEFTPGGAWLVPITASIVAGGLGLLVIQCLVAQGAFGFLIPYWVGATVAFGWILAAASGPAEVAWILLTVKVATLAVLALLFVRTASSGMGSGSERRPLPLRPELEASTSAAANLGASR